MKSGAQGGFLATVGRDRFSNLVSLLFRLRGHPNEDVIDGEPTFASVSGATSADWTRAMRRRNLLYHETNDVASNELAVDVRLPAVIWNRSYLIPKRGKFDADKDRNLKSDPQGEMGRRLSIKEVRTFIDAGMMDFLQSEEGRYFTVDPSIDGNIVLFNGVFKPGTIAHGRKAQAIDDASLSSHYRRILAADERAVILVGPYADAASRYQLKIKVHLRTNLFTLSIIASPEDVSLHHAILNDERDFDFYTIRFWDELSRRLAKTTPTKRFFAGPATRGVFADSRGVILSSYSIAASRKAQESFDAGICWAAPIIAHLAPILTPLQQRGCTATYLLEKQAVTVTTFGNQPLSQQGRDHFPLTFVMCVHGDLLEKQTENWTRLMGYVLSRSHTITTMRLAALLDIRLLRDASIEMAKFDDLKMRARRLIAQYEDEEIWGGRARVAVEALGGHIAKVNSSFLNANAAGIGLTFRIESSKFYIAEFHKHVEALSLSQIDGYQSYSQVIEGSVGITFEFISRLGVRYDRMLAESTSIIQSFLSAQTRHSRNLVTEIQLKGELILIGILVPYYLIATISHVIGDETARVHELLWQMIFAGIWASCGCTALYRALISKYKTTRLQTAAAKASCALLIVALGLAFLALWYWELKSPETRPAAQATPAPAAQPAQRGGSNERLPSQ